MSDTQLRECPFCGGEFVIRIGGMIYIPQCTKCGCQLVGSRTREEAIELVNTRKPIDRIVEQLEENQEFCTQSKSSNDYELGQFNAYEDAIEIVKRGGTN